MNYYLKRILMVVVCIVITVVPFFVPPWGGETSFMPINKIFSAFNPGQYITTPFFAFLAVTLTFTTISRYLTQKQIDALKEKNRALKEKENNTKKEASTTA